MSEFTVLYDGGADFYQRFFFTQKHPVGRDFFAHLIAIDITDKGIVPLYLPLFTVNKRSGQLSLWINFDRWRSLIILVDRNGIQTKYTDVRKEFDNE